MSAKKKAKRIEVEPSASRPYVVIVHWSDPAYAESKRRIAKLLRELPPTWGAEHPWAGFQITTLAKDGRCEWFIGDSMRQVVTVFHDDKVTWLVPDVLPDSALEPTLDRASQLLIDSADSVIRLSVVPRRGWWSEETRPRRKRA